MDLTSSDRVRKLLKLGTVDQLAEDQLQRFIKHVSSTLTQLLDRELVIGPFTEYFDVRAYEDQVYALRGPPITTITSVKNDSNRDWASSAALVASADYLTYPDGRLRVMQQLVTGPQALQVVYNGGMATDLAGLEAGFADVVSCATMEVGRLFQRRDALEAVTLRLGGGDTTQFNESVLLPDTKTMLANRKRWAL